MEKLPPKKEREENLKWIKWSTIFSWIAVILTWISGYMAYNASINSAKISGQLSKENEIERRNWDEKYKVYIKLIDILNWLESHSWYLNPWTMIWFNETFEQINKIRSIDSSLIIFWSKNINTLKSCLYLLWDLMPDSDEDKKIISELASEYTNINDKKWFLEWILWESWFNQSVYEKWFYDSIYPLQLNFALQIRAELLNKNLPQDIIAYDWKFWETPEENKLNLKKFRDECRNINLNIKY